MSWTTAEIVSVMKLFNLTYNEAFAQLEMQRLSFVYVSILGGAKEEALEED
ncbi:hypothetical protein KKC67_01630 [Patescibacteria group bacterium]|nr:hypothetical protein [Patescibacteria group bacterium]MBU0879501.1 hypothetical protein [Patescibacteria group bacterium]MBU0897519.1 hypothetical protein [Patescibacteria group bacterium]MBU1991698.1 hypothetical protein [Patescibacteria group bacterium]MBU2214702.1 hypothetical protein [Patescibacteria group bacterium]